MRLVWGCNHSPMADFMHTDQPPKVSNNKIGKSGRFVMPSWAAASSTNVFSGQQSHGSKLLAVACGTYINDITNALVRVPDFAIGNSSRVHFSLGGLPPPQTPRVAVGGLRPPTPLRKVGLRPPWALGPILDGALGPMGPGPRLDLELFGPKMGFWEIEKQKGARLGPRWGHLG